MFYQVTYIDTDGNQVGPIANVNSRGDGTIALMRQNAKSYNSGRHSHISGFKPSPCGNVRVRVTEREE